MKLYREGNKVIIECEELDCGLGDTPEMLADSFVTGFNYGRDAAKNGLVIGGDIRQSLDALLEPVIQDAQKDFNERWEIIPAPVDPPAGGEDAG